MNCETEVISACKECGGSGVLMRNPDGTHFIRCAQCSASSCDYPEIQDAIFWWNTDNRKIERDFEAIVNAVCVILMNDELSADAMVAEIGTIVN